MSTMDPGLWYSVSNFVEILAVFILKTMLTSSDDVNAWYYAVLYRQTIKSSDGVILYSLRFKSVQWAL